MPDGKFHFKGTGRVVSKTHSVRDGKDHYSHEVEIHSMEPHEGSAKDTEPKGMEEGSSIEEEFDKIQAKKSKK